MPTGIGSEVAGYCASFTGDDTDWIGSLDGSSTNVTLVGDDRTGGSEAYSFGGDGYISLGTSATLNPRDPTDGVTYSAWIKPSSWGTQWVIGRDEASGRSFALGVHSVSKAVALQINGAATASSSAITSFELDKWAHLCAVGSSASGWKIYLDGVQVASASWSQPNSTATSTEIGRRTYSGSEGYFNGEIDDVRILDEAIDSTGIAKLSSRRGYDEGATYGLVAQYSATKTQDATDSAGSNDGTLTGDASVVSDVSDDGTHAYDFDGAGDYIVCGTSGVLNPRDPLSGVTYAAWIKPASWGVQWVVSRDTSSGRSFALGLDDDSQEAVLQINGSVTIAVSSVSGLQLDEWAHICAIGSDADGWELYVNGSLVGSSSWSRPNETETATRIGSREFSGFEGYFDGLIDDVRIYDTAIDGATLSSISSSRNYLPYSPQLGRAVEAGVANSLSVVSSIPVDLTLSVGTASGSGNTPIVDIPSPLSLSVDTGEGEGSGVSFGISAGSSHSPDSGTGEASGNAPSIATGFAESLVTGSGVGTGHYVTPSVASSYEVALGVGAANGTGTTLSVASGVEVSLASVGAGSGAGVSPTTSSLTVAALSSRSLTDFGDLSPSHSRNLLIGH
ncbi:LamG domain-containing protein [Aporhodopirellula aestuarii]|uniref:LamG-like jellyroll fold domain-containing protein n=1 Tax=Aporhodopirellula aestuarii TaxID=2950107 RepID=A0ABT0TYG5_9BACT|nr:LamG domain-containing protein [Aporhodopirellula aestuarii]MCM2369637.1 hypothetical protein [Aporhodopirellula aestuarii]